VSQLGPRIESSCIYANSDRRIFPDRTKICLPQLGTRFQKLRLRDSHFLQKHVNWNQVHFTPARFSARGYLSSWRSTHGDESRRERTRWNKQRNANPAASPRSFPAGNHALLIDHPFADRKWVIAKELSEPRWFLLCTLEGQTLASTRASFELCNESAEIHIRSNERRAAEYDKNTNDEDARTSTTARPGNL
jgi:hypothetical protein